MPRLERSQQNSQQQQLVVRMTQAGEKAGRRPAHQHHRVQPVHADPIDQRPEQQAAGGECQAEAQLQVPILFVVEFEFLLNLDGQRIGRQPVHVVDDRAEQQQHADVPLPALGVGHLRIEARHGAGHEIPLCFRGRQAAEELPHLFRLTYATHPRLVQSFLLARLDFIAVQPQRRPSRRCRRTSPGRRGPKRTSYCELASPGVPGRRSTRRSGRRPRVRTIFTWCQWSSQFVPGVVLVEIFCRRAVNDKNLVGVVVGLFAQMDVIEMPRVLIAEDQAHVAVPIIRLGAQHVGFEHEVADHHIFDQREVQGAAIAAARICFGETGCRPIRDARAPTSTPPDRSAPIDRRPFRSRR